MLSLRQRREKTIWLTFLFCLFQYDLFCLALHDLAALFVLFLSLDLDHVLVPDLVLDLFPVLALVLDLVHVLDLVLDLVLAPVLDPAASRAPGLSLNLDFEFHQ